MNVFKTLILAFGACLLFQCGEPASSGNDGDGGQTGQHDAQIGEPDATSADTGGSPPDADETPGETSYVCGVDDCDDLVLVERVEPALESEGTVDTGEKLRVDVALPPTGLPFELSFGDGESVSLNDSGKVRHAYERPGEYPISLTHDSLPLDSRPVESVDGRTIPPSIALAMQWQPASPSMQTGHGGRLLIAGPSSPPGDIAVNATGASNQSVSLSIVLTDPAGTASVLKEVRSKLSDDGDATWTVALPVLAPGLYHIQIDTENALEGTVLPATLSVLDGFVTEPECEEIRRQYEELRAQRAAQCADCDELEKALEELKKRLEDLRSERAALKARRDGIQSQIDDLEADNAEKIEQVNSALGYNGSVQEYESLEDISEGSQFIGTGGIGVAFESAGRLLSQSAAFKKAHGRSLLATVRLVGQQKNQIESLQNDLAQTESEIDAKNEEIKQAKADIEALQKQLSDCRSECDDLAVAIQELIDLEQACLDKIAEQNAVSDRIARARSGQSDAATGADQVAGAADGVADNIDGRAGSPAELEGDRDALRECEKILEAARAKLKKAEDKTDDAEQSLANGDIAEANDRMDEAEQLKKEADALLEEARECVRDTNIGVSSRPRRQCEDGDIEKGTPYEFTVWDEIRDVSLSTHGGEPGDWASTLENGREAVKGLQNFLKLMDILGEAGSPIEGTVTPNADEAVEGIFNAYVELFNASFPFDVWLEMKGHHEWRRTDRVCVNGLWTTESHSGDSGDSFVRRKRIGTIWGGDRDSRQEQLEKIISRFARGRGLTH
jgi:septal ring factor EnvC (AmiA/AmiB activator)